MLLKDSRNIFEYKRDVIPHLQKTAATFALLPNYHLQLFWKGSDTFMRFHQPSMGMKNSYSYRKDFFQPTWLQCKSPYKECRNSCGTSCGVAVELPAYSVKVKVDTTKSRKQISKSISVLYL